MKSALRAVENLVSDSGGVDYYKFIKIVPSAGRPIERHWASLLLREHARSHAHTRSLHHHVQYSFKHHYQEVFFFQSAPTTKKIELVLVLCVLIWRDFYHIGKGRKHSRIPFWWKCVLKDLHKCVCLCPCVCESTCQVCALHTHMYTCGKTQEIVEHAGNC